MESDSVQIRWQVAQDLLQESMVLERRASLQLMLETKSSLRCRIELPGTLSLIHLIHKAVIRKELQLLQASRQRAKIKMARNLLLRMAQALGSGIRKRQRRSQRPRHRQQKKSKPSFQEILQNQVRLTTSLRSLATSKRLPKLQQPNQTLKTNRGISSELLILKAAAESKQIEAATFLTPTTTLLTLQLLFRPYIRTSTERPTSPPSRTSIS
jgi:hypothetical protein